MRRSRKRSPTAEYDVYTRKNCPWCTRAVRLLNESGKSHRKHDLPEGKEARRVAPRGTVPAVWAGDRFVGGYEDLARELSLEAAASVAEDEPYRKRLSAALQPKESHREVNMLALLNWLVGEGERDPHAILQALSREFPSGFPVEEA